MNSRTSEQGFVLPIAIGVGLIAILLGIMVVARSSQNRITATAQRETARSLAAAETGITQFQSLLDRYRPLSTFCSSPTATCTAPKTWQSATNSDLAPDGICEANPASRVQGYANQQWQDISANSADGQFRLFSYVYDNSTPSGAQLGTGTLIVDGRVNANDDGSISARTSTTRINVQFKINDGRVNAGTLPGLWIRNDAVSRTDATTLNTTIRNSACLPDPVTANKFASVPVSPYQYEAAPGESFPGLPQRGMSLAEFGTYSDISAVNDSTAALAAPAVNTAVSYRVAAVSGLSLNLTNSTLTVGTSGKPATFSLYLDGGVNVSGSGQIKVAPGSKLLIYTHSSVTLAGNTNLQIAQDGTSAPENVQLYVYPMGATGPAVSLSGGSGAAMNLFLFAPKSQVTMTLGATVAGMIWADSWVGSGGAKIIQSSIPAIALSGVIFPPRITPITSWQREGIS
jgi:hypothetical protein